MSARPTVVVAMSGGVDSSTAAALLVERGYRVIGVMMRLWSEGDEGDGRFGANRCCSPQAVADARGVCQRLDIPFYLLNFEADFKAQVVDFFLDGYARGTTPNPCLQCNRQIKFGILLEKAEALGADYLATGHYARVRQQREGLYHLLKGIDPKKDQSYALHVLNQKQLSRAIFPLGDLTKEQTREKARQLGLHVADKGESQDLCFIADGNYRHFLRRHIPKALAPGDVVDTHGRVLGRHDGLAFYTIGQRKGLNVAVGEPLYVLRLDAARNAVIVGRAEELGQSELTASGVNWIAGTQPKAGARLTAKIRYRAPEVPATIIPLLEHKESSLASGRTSDTVHVVFDQPLRDITPGQAVVFYDGEVCLGGGVIQAPGRVDHA